MLSAVCPMFALAQSIEYREYQTESGLQWQPSMKVTTGYDSNVTLAKQNEISSSFLRIAPKLELEAERERSLWVMKYRMDGMHYFSSNDDDYLDHFFDASYLTRAGIRHRFEVKAKWYKGHNRRGTGISESNDDFYFATPVEHTTQGASINYQFGANEARGRVSLDGEWERKHYDNYRDQTRINDYQRWLGGAEFQYRKNAQRAMYIRVELEDKQFSHSSTKDNQSLYYLAGLRWDISELTQGEAELGYQNKRFDSANREDFSGLYWLLAMKWKPIPFSVIDIETSQEARDPDVDGDYIQETAYSLTWQQNYAYHFYSRLGVKYLREDYTGDYFGSRNRLDKTWRWLVSVGYLIRDDWNIVLAGSVFDKESTRNDIGYDRYVMSLSTEFSF